MRSVIVKLHFSKYLIINLGLWFPVLIIPQWQVQRGEINWSSSWKLLNVEMLSNNCQFSETYSFITRFCLELCIFYLFSLPDMVSKGLFPMNQSVHSICYSGQRSLNFISVNDMICSYHSALNNIITNVIICTMLTSILNEYLADNRNLHVSSRNGFNTSNRSMSFDEMSFSRW